MLFGLPNFRIIPNTGELVESRAKANLLPVGVGFIVPE
jgi:hypothetical protein